MSSPARYVVAGAVALALTGCGAGASLVGVGDAPAQVTTAAPIGRDSAQKVAARVLTQAAAAEAAPAAEAQKLRTASLTGSALAVADAAAKLGSTAKRSTTTAPLTRTDPPKVLAVTRGTSWPRLILVQSTSPDGAPVLNLLISPDAATPFRLSSSVTMQPGTVVAALDPLDEGSPRVTGATKLAVQPDELLTEYAASLAYPEPAPAKAVATNDPFSTAVRANAAAQAKAFGKLATLQQKHTVHPLQTVSLALKGGGALVFALLERTDTISLKPGGRSLTPSAEFQRLVGKKALSKNAVLRSYETVAFTVPAEGKASVVGADEVLFSAKGS